MSIKLLMCAALLASLGAAAAAEEADALLAALGGARGGNALWVCGGNGAARCRAVLWRRRWALARAQCAGHVPRAAVERVLRRADGDACDDLSRGAGAAARARSVAERHVHPAWRGSGCGGAGDLVLLQLDRGYDDYDALPNYTTAWRLLQEFQPWMEDLFGAYWRRARLQAPTAERLARRPLALSTPLLTFCATVLLPAGLFLAFFLFVTFCTGTPVKVPYENVDDYQATSPWIEHKLSPGVKCRTTCGQV